MREVDAASGMVFNAVGSQVGETVRRAVIRVVKDATPVMVRSSDISEVGNAVRDVVIWKFFKETE